MTIERFVFDFDEIEANGQYCSIEEPYWPQGPSKSGLLESITGPFLRSRDRVRRILVEAAIQSLALAGDHMTAHLQYDGGQEPRLLSAIITGERQEPRYEYDHLNGWVLPGEATVDLGLGGPPIKARNIRIVPIREITTTEGEGS